MTGFKTLMYECHVKCAPSSHDPSVNMSNYEKVFRDIRIVLAVCYFSTFGDFKIQNRPGLVS